MKKSKHKAGEVFQRTADMGIRQIKEEERRVSVSFSSEIAVQRWYGNEILCHDEGCIDLTRLSEIGVSLWNHNRDKVIGRIENAYLNSAEKRTYCDIVFDDDEESERVYQKVKSGTLKGVSVGYGVSCWESVKDGAFSSNGRFLGPCEVATKWQPYEVSIVSVPADATVGVGRELEEIEDDHERISVLSLQELQVKINENYI